MKRWREDAGLTQRALAQRLNKPYSYVWKVEAAERRIDPIEFVSWCKRRAVPPTKGITLLDG